MSWNVNATSKEREALVAAINKKVNMPTQLKQMFEEQVLRMACPDGFAINVVTTGHRDLNYCYGDFKVQLTRVV